jgi:CheY-like chemotaxis protein
MVSAMVVPKYTIPRRELQRPFPVDFVEFFVYYPPDSGQVDMPAFQPMRRSRPTSPNQREIRQMAKKSSVLVVDDEEALRSVLSSELTNEGYDVRTASDGDEAIVEIDKSNFDLVLLDIKMPRVNGFDVLKHIKERRTPTKVVMLTGFADLKNAIESKKLGADDFVSKPYDLVDLLTTIERVLNE